MNFKNKWALILGGSSGFGLATAKKLSSNGMNICIVHRDRKGSMNKIQEEFETIRKNSVKLITYNDDALDPDIRNRILDDLLSQIGTKQVALMMHSIAFGNLKLLVAQPDKGSQKSEVVSRLAEELNVTEDELQDKIDNLFTEGLAGLNALASPPRYNPDLLLNEEDIANTAYAMGTSLISWTQDIFTKDLFAEYAQIVGLTSEGNKVAWLGYAAVSIAKCALESASRGIAREFAPYGIRSNIIQAGVTYTPALKLIPGSDRMMAKAKLEHPCRRLTQVEDVANVISLLCTTEALWINGSLIRVDGGEAIVK